MNHHPSLVSVCLVALFLLSGCAAVKSVPLDPRSASPEGVVYYLPKRLLKVEFVRATAPDAADLKKDNAKFEAAATALEAAEKDRAAAERLLTNLKAGTPAYATAQEDLDRKTAIKTLAKIDADAAARAVAETVSKNASAAGGTTKLTDSFTITALPAVADTAHRYSLNAHHLVTRSDRLELKTSSSGLLTNAVGKSEDKLGDILVALTQSLAAGKARTADFKTSVMTESLPPRKIEKAINCGNGLSRDPDMAAAPFKLELVFDPLEKLPEAIAGNKETDPWSYLESTLCSKGADYRFAWSAVGQSLQSASATQKDPELKAWPGIFYRRTLPYNLAIFSAQRDSDSSKYIALKFVSLELPNQSPPELLAYKAGAFTTTDLIAEFQDGMLTSHTIIRPSDALAVVKVPLDITRALVSIPAEILQLRVNVNNQEAALIEARTKVLKNQALLDAEEEKAKAKDK